MQCLFFDMLTIKHFMFVSILKFDVYVNTFVKRCLDWVLLRPTIKKLQGCGQGSRFVFLFHAPVFQAVVEGKTLVRSISLTSKQGFCYYPPRSLGQNAFHIPLLLRDKN